MIDDAEPQKEEYLNPIPGTVAAASAWDKFRTWARAGGKRINRTVLSSGSGTISIRRTTVPRKGRPEHVRR